MPKRPRYFARSGKHSVAVVPDGRKRKGTAFDRAVIAPESIRRRHSFEALRKGRMVVGTGKSYSKGSEGVYLGRYLGKLNVPSKGRKQAKYLWEMQATHMLKNGQYVKLKKPRKVRLVTLTQKGLKGIREKDREP